MSPLSHVVLTDALSWSNARQRLAVHGNLGRVLDTTMSQLRSWLPRPGHDLTGHMFWSEGVRGVVIEAGVVAGYVVAWAVRKARRVAGRLDDEADEVIDAGLDRLHEVVAAKLEGYPVLEELGEEAAAGAGRARERPRQQVELALTAAARMDEAFGQAVTELVAGLREAEQAAG